MSDKSRQLPHRRTKTSSSFQHALLNLISRTFSNTLGDTLDTVLNNSRISTRVYIILVQIFVHSISQAGSMNVRSPLYSSVNEDTTGCETVLKWCNASSRLSCLIESVSGT
jgi:hypothetical protein